MSIHASVLTKSANVLTECANALTECASAYTLKPDTGMESPMQSNMLASLGRPLWSAIEAHDIDADALFKQQGLDPSLIREPRGRYPFDLLCKAGVEAVAVTNKDHLGLEVGKHFTPLDLNALGVTFLSSTNLLEAFARLDRYESLVNSSLDITIVEEKDRLGLLSNAKGIPDQSSRIVEDIRTSVLIHMARLGLNGSVDPLEVAFTYPEPKTTGEYFGLLRCPVLFSQPVSGISFSMTDVKRPFSNANRELAISNDRFLDEMIKDLKSSDLVTQVKRAIIERLPSGAPSEEEVAKSVFVGSRTLQRRLAEKDTNFRTLLMEVRRDLAEKYISDPTMPLAEISYMLGFSDTSAFSRAFKTWTGDPPAGFRDKL